MLDLKYEELKSFCGFISGFDDPENETGLWQHLDSFFNLVKYWSYGDEPDTVGEMLKLVEYHIVNETSEQRKSEFIDYLDIVINYTIQLWYDRMRPIKIIRND